VSIYIEYIMVSIWLVISVVAFFLSYKKISYLSSLKSSSHGAARLLGAWVMFPVLISLDGVGKGDTLWIIILILCLIIVFAVFIYSVIKIKPEDVEEVFKKKEPEGE